MKERPILFSAPMVRAILAGQKTQTRRAFSTRMDTLMHAAAAMGEVSHFLEEGSMQPNDLDYVRSFCPYGQPGDRLWVRETFVQGYDEDPVTGCLLQYDSDGNRLPMKTWYRASDRITWSDDDGWEANIQWKPSIHMPRSACRILLEITAVRVERLNDISEADCWAEGIEEVMHDFDEVKQCEMANRLGYCIDDGKPLFTQLWESINGPSSWLANPWVWVVEFNRIDQEGAKP